MTSHRVVTLERNGGYAARCETCGDITFGGFRTRTEARAALVHATKAAAEVQLDGGNDPSGEGKLMDNSTLPTTCLFDTADVEDYCREIRAVHFAQAKPITGRDDPRVPQLVGVRPYLTKASIDAQLDETDPDLKAELMADLGMTWFEDVFDGKPVPPVTPPTWAVAYRVEYSDWPNVNVDFDSGPHKAGTRVQWFQNACITVEDDVAPDGSFIPAGTVLRGEYVLAHIGVGQKRLELEVPVDQLGDVAAALAHVAESVGERAIDD